MNGKKYNNIIEKFKENNSSSTTGGVLMAVKKIFSKKFTMQIKISGKNFN